MSVLDQLFSLCETLPANTAAGMQYVLAINSQQPLGWGVSSGS